MNRSHYRVGIFQSFETYVLEQGEWFRDAERSTKALPDLINDFLATSGAEVTYVSQPLIELLAKQSGTAQYRTSASIIYVPAEVITDGKEAVQGGAAVSSGNSGVDEVLQKVLQEISGISARQGFASVTAAAGDSAAGRPAGSRDVSELRRIPRRHS
jgi:hypothetical protein